LREGAFFSALQDGVSVRPREPYVTVLRGDLRYPSFGVNEPWVEELNAGSDGLTEDGVEAGLGLWRNFILITTVIEVVPVVDYWRYVQFPMRRKNVRDIGEVLRVRRADSVHEFRKCVENGLKDRVERVDASIISNFPKLQFQGGSCFCGQSSGLFSGNRQSEHIPFGVRGDSVMI